MMMTPMAIAVLAWTMMTTAIENAWDHEREALVENYYGRRWEMDGEKGPFARSIKTSFIGSPTKYLYKPIAKPKGKYEYESVKVMPRRGHYADTILAQTGYTRLPRGHSGVMKVVGHGRPVHDFANYVIVKDVSGHGHRYW